MHYTSRWFDWTPEFITYQKAARLLGKNRNYISIFKHANKNKVPYIFKENNLVDVNWFIINIISRQELKNEIHNIFFYMTEEGWNAREIARALIDTTGYSTERSWEVFLSSKMWQEGCCMKHLADPPIKALLIRDNWESIFNKGYSVWRKKRVYQKT